MSTGALSPQQAAEETLETGVHHLEEDFPLTFLKKVYGALLVSAGGPLSLTITTGTPGLSEHESRSTSGRVVHGLPYVLWRKEASLFNQNQDGISKSLALHLPFFISTAAKCPHTVEYMYLGLKAMFLGSPMTIGMFIWKCLLPVTLGNTVGGGFFTGAYSWWAHIYCNDKRAANGDGCGDVRLDDDE
ncbi:hypothetical protein AUEXF2481DRAFT_26586 [Aureobasidium subglaciale EXF-2481]|uniref:Uncharacterized protein n=1 Tax=Aureobasidium subglaciale (strain EXF-2481) TaxID=1043005 RepID=A0A074YVK6_AURSE|nr:uncharacterized protein AUEXF2481DRAFT_26586 [Aureobasidium subglaciale EXF-2481]KEQ98192.1 hypothetical protein AUEXF2481DRAFT_26586 [Aureobasidium subglaciale EXF-2481]